MKKENFVSMLIVCAIALFVITYLFILATYVRNGPVQAQNTDTGLLSGGTAEVLALEGTGPYGETPAAIDILVRMLTRKDSLAVVRGNFTAAVCMQDLNNDWSRLQVRSIRTVLSQYGVKVMAVTDGEFDVDKQIADYRNVIEMTPDILITIPLDAQKCAPALRTAVQKGIRIVFIDAVPEGFEHGVHYAGLGVADSYANGKAGAEIIAQRLDGEGQVALLHWKNRMFTCDQRSRAVRETLARYPGIKVVAEEEFTGVFEVKALTRGLLSRLPQLDALWVVWDTPALEAVKVIREQGKPVVVATVDLSLESAHEIARNDVLIGTGTQHPYDQGTAEALMAVIALAGKMPPPYVAVPAEKVTRSSLDRAWQRVFHGPLPEEIKKML